MRVLLPSSGKIPVSPARPSDDPPLVVVIGTEAIRVVLDVRGAEVTLLEPVENFLRIVAEADSEVIDEMHGSALVDLGVEGHLREGRATVNECATKAAASKLCRK
jgi:hypothetical protein